ncbi:hypothetical protein RHMOL_Rhmol05G0030300 [Rhododendron molle]|uniref:Uncharacterized protein n=1 Tax=Rhododendron molle TaxID=49168 RepID=A0ACC0NLI8_RHOML|nr:hypothetical protein RHMOL_Rhmol05G0030300 [Rhododendron molle]
MAEVGSITALQGIDYCCAWASILSLFCLPPKDSKVIVAEELHSFQRPWHALKMTKCLKLASENDECLKLASKNEEFVVA